MMPADLLPNLVLLLVYALGGDPAPWWVIRQFIARGIPPSVADRFASRWYRPEDGPS